MGKKNKPFADTKYLKAFRSHVQVDIPLDKDGMFLLQCQNCRQNFKITIKKEPDPSWRLHCPYCLTAGNIDFFSQKVLSDVVSEMIKESLYRQIERATGFEGLAAKSSEMIAEYLNWVGDTNVSCDSCGMNFAVYGVFTSCPACSKLPTLAAFRANTALIQERVRRLTTSKLNMEDQQAILRDALLELVASFDHYGKKLRDQFKTLLPLKPENLFQNLAALSDALEKNCRTPLNGLMTADEYSEMFTLFEVMNTYRHTTGVVDDKAITKAPRLRSWKGRKYRLRQEEILSLAELLLKVTPKLERLLQDNSSTP